MRIELVAGMLLVAVAAAANPQSNYGSIETENAVIRLTDGTEVPVTLRRYRDERPPVPESESLSAVYRPLARAATAGNVPAARFLGKALRVCQSAFTSAPELEAAVATLHRTGMRHYGNSREPVDMSGAADNTEAELAMRKHFRFCDGISKRDAYGATSWTLAAVDAGDYDALHEWVRLIGENDESFRLWHDAFARGYVDAAQQLVHYYQLGISVGMAGEPDPFNAYVYQAIAYKVTAAAAGAANAAGSEHLYTMLEQMGQQLGPDQRHKADRKVAAILSDNEACCLVPDYVGN